MRMQISPQLIEVQCTCPYRLLVYKCYNSEDKDKTFFLKKKKTKPKQTNKQANKLQNQKNEA